MAKQSDAEYFLSRAQIERSLSDTASDPGVALIHTQLADRYEKLANGVAHPRPSLQVVANG